MNNFYVDDLIGGNHSFNDAVKCKDELFQALEPHHFNLRKWTSNNDKFLDTVAPLLSVEEFQMFRIIPVPVQQGHEQISISPESPYLLITIWHSNDLSSRATI